MKQEIILTEEGIKEVCKEARTRFLGNIEHIVDLMPEEDAHQKRLKETISLAVTGIKELMPRYEDAFKSALIDYEDKIYPLVSIALEERGEVWLPSLGISKEFLDKVGTDMTGFLEYMNDVLEAFGNALYGIHKRLGDASKLQALFVNVDKKRFQA